MCPDHANIDELFTQQIKDNFYKKFLKVYDMPFINLFENKSIMKSEQIQFPVMPDKNTELLEDINKKLDHIISHFGIPSAYIFTGKDVIDEFKKLNGDK